MPVAAGVVPWALRQPPWRLLAALTTLHAAAVALFSSGFLLTRVELTQRSRCNDDGCFDGGRTPQGPDGVEHRSTAAECAAFQPNECPQMPSATTTPTPHDASITDATSMDEQHRPGNGLMADVTGGFCCAKPHFNKTLWLIIDALRFDFVLHEPLSATEGTPDGKTGLPISSNPSSSAPPRPPHVQKMPELLSLGRDWVRAHATLISNHISCTNATSVQ